MSTAPGKRMVEQDGEVLAGGNTSVVQKVGGTVRRSAGPWTSVIHDLLRHVRQHGFDLAPDPLGLDASGREVLRFVPGETTGAVHPWPEWAWSDELLAQAASAARRYHAAVACFRPEGIQNWRSGAAPLGPHEIVCHNDFAPYNVVVREGKLVALLDWDFASPGTPVWDLAFMAWQWVPLHHRALRESLGGPGPGELAPRLRLLCDRYGLRDRSALIGTVIDRIQSSRDGILRLAGAGDPAFKRLLDEGHAADMALTLDSVNHARSKLESAISPA